MTYKTTTNKLLFLDPEIRDIDNLNPRLNQFKHRYVIVGYNTEGFVMFELRFMNKEARKKALTQLRMYQ